MQTLKIFGMLALAGLLLVVAMITYDLAPRPPGMTIDPAINSFEDCVAAGNPVMESYPRQCQSKDGRFFIEEIAEVPDPNEGLGLQANGCAVAGCSGQLCVSADEAGDIVTTCEFRSEYACYREASCEPQANGQCGWTQTAELQRCLANPPALDAQTDLQVL